MKFIQSLKMALASIASNKMRSLLTMLGIIIGVLAVTLLISIASGTTSQVTDRIAGMGTNLLTANLMGERNNTISTEELKTLVEDENISAIAPSFSNSSTAKGGSNTYDTTVDGATPELAQIRNITVAQGRFILQTDVDARTAVAVIGTDLAQELFSSTNVVGNVVTIEGREFKIVGVLESSGSTSMGSADNKLIIPLTTAQRLYQDTGIRSFYASATSQDTVSAAQEAIEHFLFKKTQSEDDYRVFNQTELLSTMDSVVQSMTLMLGGIAGISLLVGGIGIMNIMLVSVTERTREIGIRKAVGARRKDIMGQFLIEAIVLSLSGGIIGVLLSIVGAIAASSLMSTAVTVSVGVAIAALLFSVAVGVLFGVYPAAKASKLRPIDALRYE